MICYQDKAPQGDLNIRISSLVQGLGAQDQSVGKATLPLRWEERIHFRTISRIPGVDDYSHSAYLLFKEISHTGLSIDPWRDHIIITNYTYNDSIFKLAPILSLGIRTSTYEFRRHTIKPRTGKCVCVSGEAG